MILPNPAMDAVPFTPLTAEFLDNMIENIEFLGASPYGVVRTDTTNGTALSGAGTFKTISLTGLTAGRTYQVFHNGPVLGVSGLGTATLVMKFDGVNIAHQSITTAGSSFQNPAMNISGWFVATGTNHTITITIEANGLTPSTTSTTQRTIVLALHNPTTNI